MPISITRPFFRSKSTSTSTIKATLAIAYRHIVPEPPDPKKSSSTTTISTTLVAGQTPPPGFHSTNDSHHHQLDHEQPALQSSRQPMATTAAHNEGDDKSPKSSATASTSAFHRPARPVQTSSAPPVVVSSSSTTTPPTTGDSTDYPTTESNATSPSPQFTLLAHHQPASWTIALVLEELGLTYSIIPVGVQGTSNKSKINSADDEDDDLLGWASKTQLKVSVPALVDHSNKDLVLIETGAIVMYLVERYGLTLTNTRGKGQEICPEDDEEKAIARQWVFFNFTEHSLSFSQACHFLYDHPQKLPSAITYTTSLVHHSLNTLNTILSTSPTGYLVPTRASPTYADLVFWSWNWVYESGGFPMLVDGGCSGACGQEQDCWRRYPYVGEWQGEMSRRESVQRVVEKWESLKLEYV